MNTKLYKFKKQLNIKYIILALLLKITVVNGNDIDQNLGFMMNQKYACVSTHGMIGDKIIQIQSLEDAMKYPSRFYIDDNHNLHTDGREDNIFTKLKTNIYESQNSAIILKIIDNKRYMLRAIMTGELKGFTLIHECIETDNWTLVR